MRRFLSLFTMLMLCGVLAFAQNRVVTGTITDDKGAPIEGASIKVKGTRSGTSADAYGNYRLSVPAGATLVISGVGITPKETTVGSQSVVNLSVTRTGASELTAVVVTAAGIRRSEKTTGYAISKVDPGALTQKSEPDVLKGLQGKVAGVDIRSSQGTPGAATRIQIRGNSSFYGDNQPLIIVDGVPYSNEQVTTSSSTTGGGAYGSGISDLDPNDIASFNILKGASAAALYGSRASNGVIIITTKSGSVARTKKGLEVTAKSSVSFENIGNLPTYQNLYGTGSQFGAANANGSWGKRFAPGDSLGVWADYAAAYPELFPTGKVAYKAHPDNVKSLFTTGVVTENSVGFSTGDEKTSFALTGSQLNHSGYVPNNTYNRTNISAGGGSRLSIGLNIRGNFSYSRSLQNGGLFGENQAGASSQFARSLFLGRSWDLELPFESKTGSSVSFGGAQFDNPKWAAKYNTAKTYEERYVAGLHFDFNLAKWAKVDYGVGTNVSNLNRREIQEISSRSTGKGFLKLDNYRSQEIESTLLLSLTPSTGDVFTVRATLGTNFNQRTTNRFYGSGGVTANGGGFIVKGLYTLNNFLPLDVAVSDQYSRRRIIGVLGDITLGYKNYLFVTATGRNDVSSTLPVESRSFFYPSVSGSFVFSDALKLSNSVLDFGKLRGSWAKVGHDPDPYNTLNIYNTPGSFLGIAAGSISSGANSPALQPEFTTEREFGTQLSFFKRRFELDFTYYKKNSTNQLAPVTTAPSTGYSSFYTNFGGVQNKGIEIEATVRPIRTKDFTWDLKGVFTRNRNIVTYLTEGVQRLNLGGGFTNITNELEPGKPFGYLYGSKTLRDSATGALLINPADGTMILDPNQAQIGDPNPDFKMGITNTFTYKGFFANVLFDMTKGGDLYSVTISSELGRGVTKDTEDRETGWVIPGVYGSPVTGKAILSGGKTIPNQTRITTNDLYFSPGGGNTFAINTATEWNVYDATVYRLREISIGYQFPKTLFAKSRISSATFSISGRNLWYYAPGFPKYTHFDPEVSTYGSSSVQGLEFSAAPTTKRIGINLNITF